MESGFVEVAPPVPFPVQKAQSSDSKEMMQIFPVSTTFYVFVGKTDLRKGIDGLSTLVKQKFQLDPFRREISFFFCGSSNRKIKGCSGGRWLLRSIQAAGSGRFSMAKIGSGSQGHHCGAVSSAYDRICHRSICP